MSARTIEDFKDLLAKQKKWAGYMMKMYTFKVEPKLEAGPTITIYVTRKDGKTKKVKNGQRFTTQQAFRLAALSGI